MSGVEPLASPVEAVKYVKLVLNDGSVWFRAVYERDGTRPYSNDAPAECEEGHDHVAPKWECSCGFHAVAHQEDLWRAGEGRDVFRAEVQLYGLIVEHEHGWRAGWQRVTRLILPARCSWCGERTRAVACKKRSDELFVSCGKCGERGRSLDDVASSLGCEVDVSEEWRLIARRELSRARSWCVAGTIALFVTGFMAATATGTGLPMHLAGLLSVPWGFFAEWRGCSGLERCDVEARELSQARARVRADATWIGMLGWLLAGVAGAVVG